MLSHILSWMAYQYFLLVKKAVKWFKLSKNFETFFRFSEFLWMWVVALHFFISNEYHHQVLRILTLTPKACAHVNVFYALELFIRLPCLCSQSHNKSWYCQHYCYNVFVLKAPTIDFKSTINFSSVSSDPPTSHTSYSSSSLTNLQAALYPFNDDGTSSCKLVVYLQ